MRKILTAASSAIMFLLVGSSAALAQDEAEAPEITPVETWACSYNEGKGPEDLKAVVAEWNEWMDDEGQDDYFAAIITPTFYGERNFDIGWLGTWPNANSMGAGTDHWMTAGGEIAGKFFDVMTCGSHTMFATLEIKEPPRNDDDEDNTFVLAFSNCSIEEGRTFEEYMAAQTEWNAYADEIGMAGGAWVMFPIWGENVEADYGFKFLSAASDYTTLGANTQIMFDGHWRKSNELFDDLVDCDSTRIYSATVIRQMAEDDE